MFRLREIPYLGDILFIYLFISLLLRASHVCRELCKRGVINDRNEQRVWGWWDDWEILSTRSERIMCMGVMGLLCSK